MPSTTARATWSGSASAKPISAFLPPSSSSTGLMVSAAACSTARPAGTLPTSATLAMPGCAASRAAACRSAGSTLNTPGGNSGPISSARRSADSGACSGGLMMTALPAARIAADLPAQNISGWLNGSSRATTPSGSRTEKFTRSGTHRDRCALHFRDQAGKEIHLFGGNLGVLAHLAVRVAAVGRIEHRQLRAVAPDRIGRVAQDAPAIGGRDLPPQRVALLRREDGGLDIRIARLRDLGQDLSGTGVLDRRAPLPCTLVPASAVIEPALQRQDQRGHRVPARAVMAAPVRP